ncbi:MAG: prepilin-type N-terminal cleavage/methylation domain-containing protein [Pseudomonadota bacterium]
MAIATTRHLTVRRARARGVTLLEVMLVIALAGLILLPLGRLLGAGLNSGEATLGQQDLAASARYAMQRMETQVRGSPKLLLPLADNPATAQDEATRDPGVLSVVMDPTLDRNLDGVADADNDGDGLVDEDLPNEANEDNRAGIAGIDDDNDGLIDEVGKDDDDEDDLVNRDLPFWGDEDGDGSVDEDPKEDLNDDGEPGWAGFDDDGDGTVDEGLPRDDDEDGLRDEDWWDSITYFLNDTSELIERMPNVGGADGRDYAERVIATGVASFRVARRARGTDRNDLVTIALTLSDGDTQVGFERTLRVGGAPR